MPSTVSIIVVNYNAGGCLVDCISSIVVSDPGSEIILVDNASVDGSLDAIRSRFADSNRIKIIQNKSNYGFAKACNIGTMEAKGNYLLYLNPDCKLMPHTIHHLMHCLKGYPKAGMAGGLILNDDHTEQHGCRRTIPTPWRSLIRATGLSILSSRYPKLFSDFLLYRDRLPDGPVELEAISGACMMVHRKALEDVGMMDEGYFLHCEDLDWCMRFRKKGWQIMFAPDAVLYHDKGVCSKTRPYFVEWSKHKGMIRFYNKFFYHQYPGVLMALVIAGVWIRFGMVTTCYCLRRIFGLFRIKLWKKRLSGS